MLKEISTFDKLRWVMFSLATRGAMGCAYTNWTDEYVRKELSEVWKDEESVMRRREGYRITSADFAAMTDEQKRILGFAKWDDNGPWLIPLYAFHYIADGERLWSISGDSAVKGEKEIDLDVRGGCIAYGFPISKVAS